MGIEYDPDEEVEDDVDGLIDYVGGNWRLLCSEHGLIEVAPDGSAGSHDTLLYRWVKHMKEHHHGDGMMPAEDLAMLINDPWG